MKAVILFAVLLSATAVNASDEAAPVGTSAALSTKKDAPPVSLPALNLAPGPVAHDPLQEMPPRKLFEDTPIQMEFHGEFRTILGITNMPRRQE